MFTSVFLPYTLLFAADTQKPSFISKILHLSDKQKTAHPKIEHAVFLLIPYL